jgi:hypothetical protein
MLYAMLCYNNEDTVFAWSKEQNDKVMGQLMEVNETLKSQGRLGPVARLMPTSAATTLRKQTDPPLIIDGPFAETKEPLLGFFVIDCVDLDEALETAKQLGKANPGGAYEIRPLLAFHDSKVTR